MSSVATPPNPRDPGASGARRGARAGNRWNNGLGSRGRPKPSGAARAGGRGPCLPLAPPTPRAAGDPGAPETPTGPRWRQLPPWEAGRPTPEAGEPRQASPAPNSSSARSPGRNLSSRRAARERGAAQEPRLGGRSRDSGPLPQAERRGRPGSGRLPTHLSCGPVFGSGSSGVRVAAT